jgi:hypothetical protein
MLSEQSLFKVATGQGLSEVRMLLKVAARHPLKWMHSYRTMYISRYYNLKVSKGPDFKEGDKV